MSAPSYALILAYILGAAAFYQIRIRKMVETTPKGQRLHEHLIGVSGILVFWPFVWPFMEAFLWKERRQKE